MEFIKIDNKQIFIYHYSDYNNADWVREKLKQSDFVSFKRSLHFTTNDSYEMELELDEFEDQYPPIAFLFAELVNDYYQIKKRIIGTKNNFFFHKDIDLRSEYFI